VTQFAQHLIDSLSVGSTYVLLALGLSLVFSVMGLINFAYGTLIVWGGFAVSVYDGWSVPYPLVVGLMILTVAGISLLMGRVAFRPFIGAPPSTLLLTSFGAALASQAIIIAVFGESPRAVPLPGFLGTVWSLGELRVNALQLVTVGASAGVFLGLNVLLHRSELGLRIRATAEDAATARLLGVRALRVLPAVFGISGVIAGVVAFLLFAKLGTVDPYADLTPTLKAFIVVVLGGIGTVRGAVIGGLLLGFMETILASYLPGEFLSYQQTLAFLIVIGILVLRPQGIAGLRVELSK
jgi:branched-chain amino acid transport system permease protein